MLVCKYINLSNTQYSKSNSSSSQHSILLPGLSTMNSSPRIQLRPLHELVKEVDCAGVKKFHLKRAIEDYLSQEDPCHCRPCQNNGHPLLVNSVCYCNCQDGTSGAACQVGTVARQPAGKAATKDKSCRGVKVLTFVLEKLKISMVLELFACHSALMDIPSHILLRQG